MPDIERAEEQWGWLLQRLGYERFQHWATGRSWRLADTYIVFEESTDMVGSVHDRMRPGLNHLAFFAGDRATVDSLAAVATEHGWRLLFEKEHPHAGGVQTYAAYLANPDGYEVELVAGDLS